MGGLQKQLGGILGSKGDWLQDNMGSHEAKTDQVEAQMSQFEAQMGQVEIQTGQLDRFKSRHRNIPKNQHFDAGDAMWFF